MLGEKFSYWPGSGIAHEIWILIILYITRRCGENVVYGYRNIRQNGNSGGSFQKHSGALDR
jgi:hypothetical protein